MKKTVRTIAALCAALILCVTPLFCFAADYDTIKAVSRSDVQITFGGANYSRTAGVYKNKNAVAYAVTVKPNRYTRFVSANGGRVFGRKQMSDQIAAYKGAGRVAAALNADFFSGSTGIPLGIQITEGVLITDNNAAYEREGDRRWSVGFKEDGAAVIGVPDLTVTVKIANSVITPDRVNSFPDTRTVLVTSDYGDTVSWQGGYARDVITISAKDKLTVGGTVSGSFESYRTGVTTPPATAQDKMFIIAESGKLAAAAAGKKAGDPVTVTVKDNTGGWTGVKNAVGGGNLLINNGTIRYPKTYDEAISNSFTSRSAIGVKADGTVVLYLAERDRNGDSSGVKLEAVAQALYDMGCKYAVNFDGGGSSTLAVSTGGACTVRNVCQDGGQRRIANSLLLVTEETAPKILCEFDETPQGDEKFSGKSVIDVSSDKTNVYTGAASFRAQYRFAGDTVMMGFIYKTPVALSGCSQVTLSVLPAGGARLYAILVAGGGEFKREIKTPAGEGWRKTEFYVGDAQTLLGFALESPDGKAASGSVNVDRMVGYTGYSMTDNEAPALETALSGGALVMTAQDQPFKSGTDAGGYSVTVKGVSIPAPGGKAELSSVTGDRMLRAAADAVDVFGNRARRYVFFAPAGYSAALPFSDMKESAWDTPYVRFCAEQRIINGYEDKTFRGGSKVTRAQFCAMLVRLKKLDINKYAGVKLPYGDADKIPSWVILYAKAAYAEGIMLGSKTNTGVSFFANDPITRQEAACAAARLYTPDTRLSERRGYGDADAIAKWAKESVELMSGQGIVLGGSDGKFHPKNSLTRSEAAAIMARMV